MAACDPGSCLDKVLHSAGPQSRGPSARQSQCLHTATLHRSTQMGPLATEEEREVAQSHRDMTSAQKSATSSYVNWAWFPHLQTEVPGLLRSLPGERSWPFQGSKPPWLALFGELVSKWAGRDRWPPRGPKATSTQPASQS